MQQALGDSDEAVAPDSAVENSATAIGDERPYYATADTVADLDQLRTALNARTVTSDGFFSDSFVAER